jgi:hypothetical protein
MSGTGDSVYGAREEKGMVGFAKGKGRGLRVVEGNQKGMREFEHGSTEEMINELAKKGRYLRRSVLLQGFRA